MNWTNAIGRRVLIYENYGDQSKVTEVTVIEISPSGDFVKLKWPTGFQCWDESDKYKIKEVLKNDPNRREI